MALRCVIIDDSPGFLRAARALLEKEGLRVVGVASTGAEGLRCTAAVHPDVTLLDVGLGVESGFEVARRLVDDPTGDPGQVILISAQSQDDFADMIEASPAIGFLAKQALSAGAIETLLRPPGAAGDGARETVGR